MIGTGPLSCACPELICEHEQAQDACAVIVAAGKGERFGSKRGKQFCDLAGLPVLAWSLLAFDAAPSVGQIVVVCPFDRVDEVAKDVLAKVELKREVLLVRGGMSRQESVMRGLTQADGSYELVAIHDGARPLIEVEAIERCLEAVRCDATIDGAILASPSTDTCKVVDRGLIITRTLDRASLWRAQTPQCFHLKTILDAHTFAMVEGFTATDDASIVEWRGGRVKVVEGPADNIKITVPEDLAIAEAALAARMGIA